MGQLSSTEQGAVERIDAARMLEQVLAWSAINSGSRNLAGLERMGAVLGDAFAALPGELRFEAAALVESVDAAGRTFAIEHGAHLHLTVRPQAPVQLLLTGHMDTVFGADHAFQEARWLEDGVLNGSGVADMKGGIAVMLELAGWAAEAELAYDVAFLFFPREELGPAQNPLPGVFERTGIVDEAQLVICLEPTDNTLQLGCLGNLNARVVFEGRSAHSARPWLGENAIALALESLRPVLASEPHDVDVDGLVFREVMSVTQLNAGIASNVIPARAEANVNFRYAPDRTPESAEARIREVLRGTVEITSNSPAAHVALGSPLVERLRAAGGFEVQPKQAWTNVADFAARGLDAVNLGPGATRYAHAVDERVEIAELERTFAALQGFLGGTV